MPILASEAERQRNAYKSLTRHYRGIGPAAVLAAVLAASRKKSGEQNPTAAKRNAQPRLEKTKLA